MNEDMRNTGHYYFAIHGVETIYGGKVLHLNGIFSEIQFNSLNITALKSARTSTHSM